MKNIKKAAALLLLVSFVFSLVSCADLNSYGGSAGAKGAIALFDKSETEKDEGTDNEAEPDRSFFPAFYGAYSNSGFRKYELRFPEDGGFELTVIETIGGYDDQNGNYHYGRSLVTLCGNSETRDDGLVVCTPEIYTAKSVFDNEEDKNVFLAYVEKERPYWHDYETEYALESVTEEGYVFRLDEFYLDPNVPEGEYAGNDKSGNAYEYVNSELVFEIRDGRALLLHKTSEHETVECEYYDTGICKSYKLIFDETEHTVDHLFETYYESGKLKYSKTVWKNREEPSETYYDENGRIIHYVGD